MDLKWPSSLWELWEVMCQNVTLTLLLGLTLIIVLMYLRGMTLNLPPGPRGLPLLGYYPFLSSSEPHLQLLEMRKKYGDIIGMYMAGTFTVFLCDIQSTKEALNRDEFSGRPEGSFEFSKETQNFASLSGQRWKDQRRIAVQSLRRLGIGSELLQDLTRSQIAMAIEQLKKEISRSGPEVSFRNAIQGAAIGVVFNTICGKTFPADHRVYKIIISYLKLFAESGEPIQLETFLTWYKPIRACFSKKVKESKAIFKEMEDLIWEEIDLHEKNKPEEPVDLIDYMLRERNKPGGEHKISRGELNGNVQVMLFAGADTVRSTVEWFLLCMAEYPKIQEKVFQEIDAFLGPSGEVSYGDRTQLPFTEAAILESMRFKTLLPINPVHSSLEDTTFRGYHIPKGSVIFTSMYIIHRDPKNWRYPDKYYPEHFLNSDKTMVTVPDAFIPFATGKRVCIGDKIALVESFTFCVAMLQQFKVLPPEGGVNMQGHLRVNVESCFPVAKLLPRYS